jgi:SAM-dependent methyltransferase
MGRFAFDFLVERGLQPEHRMLDFGCGALRIGLHAIDFLDEGRYFGLEAHLKSLEVAVTYELPLHGLEHKRPRLLWNGTCDVEHFGVAFDRILDFSTTMHLPHDDLAGVFARFAGVLAPEGRLLTAPRPELTDEQLERAGLRVVHEEEQETPLLSGHRFSSTNHWVELAHAV